MDFKRAIEERIRLDRRYRVIRTTLLIIITSALLLIATNHVS